MNIEAMLRKVDAVLSIRRMLKMPKTYAGNTSGVSRTQEYAGGASKYAGGCHRPSIHLPYADPSKRLHEEAENMKFVMTE
jgi:hypothetical protein